MIALVCPQISSNPSIPSNPSLRFLLETGCYVWSCLEVRWVCVSTAYVFGVNLFKPLHVQLENLATWATTIAARQVGLAKLHKKNVEGEKRISGRVQYIMSCRFASNCAVHRYPHLVRIRQALQCSVWTWARDQPETQPRFDPWGGIFMQLLFRPRPRPSMAL